MEIKELPTTFAYLRKVETNLKEIGQLVGIIPAELIEQAAQEGFKITGPQFWNYTGMDGDPDTRFQIEICIPVEESETIHSANTAYVPGFSCASEQVKGPWTNLKAAYEKIIADMASEKLQPGMLCREVYHIVDFQHPENNLTEIQLGIN